MKRIVTLIASLALVAAGLNVPAGAQEEVPPVIPETVIIDDPFQDANGLNDQGRAELAPMGDNVTPTDAGSTSDIGKVWFTDDATTVTVHIQVQLPPPAIQGLRYDVNASPGEGSAGPGPLGCARWVAIMEGETQGQTTTWQGENEAKFFDVCNDGTNWFDNGVPAEVKVFTLEDGTGIISIVAPKDASPFLATGQILTATTVTTRVAYGASGTLAGAAFYIDNTKPGIDYLITGGEAEEETPPGCAKGKGKKKGCKKEG